MVSSRSETWVGWRIFGASSDAGRAEPRAGPHPPNGGSDQRFEEAGVRLAETGAAVAAADLAVTVTAPAVGTGDERLEDLERVALDLQDLWLRLAGSETPIGGERFGQVGHDERRARRPIRDVASRRSVRIVPIGVGAAIHRSRFRGQLGNRVRE